MKSSKNKEVLDENLYPLRDELIKNGIILWREYFTCENNIISFTLVMLGHKQYIIKRINRKCVKIIYTRKLAREKRKEIYSNGMKNKV